MIECKLCGKKFKIITNTHLSTHKWSVKDYSKEFGSKGCGFLSPNLLPKNDIRYIKWRESLKKRSGSWCKGYTKETHPILMKISRTFKKKKIDNFAQWRKKAIKKGWIKTNYPSLRKSADLAELIGVILGDGHIGRFPRTEVLTIFSNSNNIGFIERYAKLIKKIFDKKPSVLKRSDSNCTKISIYQKNISKRLNIPSGARGNKDIGMPRWISNNREYLIRYLRGLYEAEGSFSVHSPTSTYKFVFANRNKSLLNNVDKGLKVLGFHPHKDSCRVQISRKKEVYHCKELIDFRNY